MNLTEEEELSCQNAEICHIYKEDNNEEDKVKHHCHLSRKNKLKLRLD